MTSAGVPDEAGEVIELPGAREAVREAAEATSRAQLMVAREALREADSLPAVTGLVNRGEVMRVAARKADLSEKACLDWEEFSLDAQRQAGQLLAAMDKPKSAPGNQYTGKLDRLQPATGPTYGELGIGKTQAHRWQKVAALPDEEYEEYKDRSRAKGEMTRAGALKLAKQARAGEDPARPGPVPEGVFTTIVADPPWRYGNTSTRAAAADHYSTLSIGQLCGREPLPDGASMTTGVVHPRAAEVAHLYLWTTSSHLPDAFAVMAAWGFTYKTYLVWVKPQMGMGNYFRVSTELVLFGVKGDMRTQAMDMMNWFECRRGKHSAKPQEFYDLVVKASPGPYLEMFARCDRGNQLEGTCQCTHCRLGWAHWGNQS